MKRVSIHSDGGCHGNPGPGGWAATLKYGEHVRELKGGVPATTNNRMELMGAIAALSALKEPCEVAFYTDSQYVRQGVTGWIRQWKANGWMTKSRKPVKNAELWRALDEAASRHKIAWHWVKGHAGQEGNERCDLLATGEIEKIKKQFTRAQLKAELEAFNAASTPPETAATASFSF